MQKLGDLALRQGVVGLAKQVLDHAQLHLHAIKLIACHGGISASATFGEGDG